MIEALVLCLVVGVSAGDTLAVRCGSRRLNVHLAGIDAPESGQPFGQRSRQALSDLCLGKQAQLRRAGSDRYGRTVATVICAAADAGAEQVRQGMAWVFERNVIDVELYSLQHEARQARRGLWADSDPLPPWEWRSGAP